MAFKIKWTKDADAKFKELEKQATDAFEARSALGKTKSSQAEGLFKQVKKTIGLLAGNPKHRSLQTHEYSGLTHPWNPKEKVWEAYAQNKTPGAYRVFWCYGRKRDELTIIAITPHP